MLAPWASVTHEPVGTAELLRRIPVPRHLIADRAYDVRKLRDSLACGCEAVTLPKPMRKRPRAYDPVAYRSRTLIACMFYRLEDFRRIATRYDEQADIFCRFLIAATRIWWLN